MVVLIEYGKYGLPGMSVNTAPTLKALFIDLVTNNGDEFALWAEGEAKKSADKWREQMSEDAAPIEGDDE